MIIDVHAHYTRTPPELDAVDVTLLALLEIEVVEVRPLSHRDESSTGTGWLLGQPCMFHSLNVARSDAA